MTTTTINQILQAVQAFRYELHHQDIREKLTFKYDYLDTIKDELVLIQDSHLDVLL